MVELARVLLGACQNAHDLIAVDHVAILIHGKATVGIAIEGNAHDGAGGLDHGLQLLRMGGAGVLVDVVAVRRRVDDGHVGAGAAQGFRSDHGRGAVRAVGHDLQALQRRRLRLVRTDRHDGGNQMVDVQVGCGGGVMADTTHAGAGRTIPILAEHRFDLVFLGVGQLEAAAGEELDAVVGHRIVGCGDHRAHFHVEHGRQVCDARRRDDAGVDHVEAAGGHASGQCGGKEIAGNSCITTDQRTATAFEFAPLVIAQHTHRGVTQIERQLCRQIPIRQSSNAVGSEHTWHESQILAICKRYFRDLSYSTVPPKPAGDDAIA